MPESARPAYSTSLIRHFEDLRDVEAWFSLRIPHLSPTLCPGLKQSIPIGSTGPL